MSAATEQQNAPDSYSLPNGWTWQNVAEQREKYDIYDRFYPIASGGAAMGWGRPLVGEVIVRHKSGGFSVGTLID